MRETVVVVGGGISGLSAALELSGGCSVTVLEARERFGGRIHTVRGKDKIPFELGAEFVHGKAPEIWRFINEAGLKTHEAPDRHWKTAPGGLVEVPDFWEQLTSVTEEIKPRQRDRSFADFISELRKPREAIDLAKSFVEGFHAAPADQASTQATGLNEESSEKLEGQRQFRINAGYDKVVDHVEEGCRREGVRLRCGSKVTTIQWDRAPMVLGLEGGEAISADRIIITLPLGVLKAGDVQFIPRIDSKMDALQALEMGVVTKVILQFRERFWPTPNFGFIQTDDEWFSVWWADERGELLTGWAGGPNGERLAREDDEFILKRGIEGVAKLFGERLARVGELLLAAQTHNWRNDPFSKGAYSFIPVHGTDAASALARPEEERLFFAGEATDLNYQFGTVHGAIASRDSRGKGCAELLELTDNLAVSFA